MIEKYVLGVTGSIGSGKSYCCKKLVSIGQKRGLAVTHIDFDIIRRAEKNPYNKFSELIQSTTSLVLAEWALLIEDNLLSIVDYNVLLLKVAEETQVKRLIGGDLPAQEIKRRIQTQFSTEEKECLIVQMQKKADRGDFYCLDSSHNPTDQYYTLLFDTILRVSRFRGNL